VLSKAFPSGLAAAILVLIGGAASADAPRLVRLEYERLDGASACPEEGIIRAGVAARLGYEPFRSRAEDRLRATVRPAGNGLEARIELLDAQGALKASRRLTSRQRDCSELAASVELAIAIAIDPMGRPHPPDDAPVPAAGEEPNPSPRQQAAAPEPAAPGPSPAAPRLGWRAQAGLLGGWGSAPALSLGFTVGAALESDRWSVGVEGRADLPSSKTLRAGEASAGLVVASLVPCVRFGVASACGLATGGVRQVAGDGLVQARHATLPYFAFGGRAAVAWPMSERAALALHGDVTAPVTKTRLTVDDEVVWTSPAIAVALGVGVAVLFP
jgi:hypothetical protein